VSQVRPFQPSTEIMVLVWQAQNGWKLLKSTNAPSLLTIN